VVGRPVLVVVEAPDHGSDKVLNHQSRAISGIVAVYQHELLDKRKNARKRWAVYIGSFPGQDQVTAQE
jgi:hypothetical protein